MIKLTLGPQVDFGSLPDVLPGNVGRPDGHSLGTCDRFEPAQDSSRASRTVADSLGHEQPIAFGFRLRGLPWQHASCNQVKRNL